jgi:hypothetical protein
MAIEDKKSYFLEATVTAAGPKGRLIFLHDTDKLPMNKQNFLARVHKRKFISTQN